MEGGNLACRKLLQALEVESYVLLLVTSIGNLNDVLFLVLIVNGACIE